MPDVGFLEEMLRIPSLSGREETLARFLVDRMEQVGMMATLDDAGNVVGIGGDPEADRTILLLGHMDTVPGRIPVRREAGRLYGRGAVDAKGPLAAFILATARITGSIKGIRVMVIGAVEEEANGRGAHYLRRSLAPPDTVIIGEPSGWEGITLGYKGLLRMMYRWESPVAHGASDHQTPAEKAVEYWDVLRRKASHVNQGRIGQFDRITPSLRGLRTESDGIHAWAEMDIVLRLPLDMPPARVKEFLVARVPDETIAFPYAEPAYRASKHTAVVRAFLRSIRASSGRPRFKLKTGTSDMNVVGPVWNCPMIAYGPGDSDLDHTPNEHIEIAEFERSVNVLENALQLLAESRILAHVENHR